MNTRTISLDIDKRHAIREPITIAQGDKNGTTIAATIYDGGTLVTTSGLTARFRMRLPDGRHFYEKTATWNAASGTATVTIDETQAASAPGTTSEAYFELLSGTTVIHSTSRFSVRVLRSATEGFDPATSYSDRVEELLDGLDELPLPGNAAPVMDGTASVGTSGRYARQDHRHPTDTSRASTAVATTSANGLMSATDKAKLDGIAANANAYELPPATASALGGVKPDGTTITVDSDGTIHGASTYELPTMTASTKGGAKLGDGLALTDGALGIDPEPQESTGEVRGAVLSLTAKGWATQDGTPTPESPVPIQVARGRNLLIEEYEQGSSLSTSATTRIRSKHLVHVVAGNHYIATMSGGTGLQFVLNSSLQDHYNFESGHYSECGTDTAWNTAKKEFTATASGYVAVVVSKTSNADIGVADMSGVTIQLELGSTPTPYVPYGHVGVDIKGGRNLIKTSRYKPSSTAESWTDWPIGESNTTNGITYTRYADGTITVVGTTPSNATSSRYFEFDYEVLADTNVALSGCPAGGDTNKYFMSLCTTDNSSLNVLVDTGSGAVGKTSKACNRIRIVITSGQTVNLTFRPQLELGSTATPYQPYINETIPVPLPSKGYVASLPDGTADVLTIDGAGKVEWTSATNMVTLDGSESWSVATVNGMAYAYLPAPQDMPSTRVGGYAGLCDAYVVDDTVSALNATVNNTMILCNRTMSSIARVMCIDATNATSAATYTAWLAQNPITVLYPLATPTTEQCGYIDWPSIPDGAIVTCPELDALGVRYLIGNGVAEMARDWYERAKSEYENRISALEQAVAELATA